MRQVGSTFAEDGKAVGANRRGCIIHGIEKLDRSDILPEIAHVLWVDEFAPDRDSGLHVTQHVACFLNVWQFKGTVTLIGNLQAK